MKCLVWCCSMLAVTTLYASTVSNFQFSVDIGSDLEMSDPTIPPDTDNSLDPGDVYYGGQGGIQLLKDDLIMFAGVDPKPLPGLSVGVYPAPPPDVQEAFDLDGEDQLPLEVIANGEPILVDGPAGGLYLNPPLLYLSFDDDTAPGWYGNDVPVTTGPSHGSAMDEILYGLGWYSWGGGVATPHLGELNLGLQLGPAPEIEDDDVDALDTTEGPYWYISADHEATAGLDPGAIYMTAPPVGGLTLAVAPAMLGLPPGTDLDAFEFLMTDDAAVYGAQPFGLTGPGPYLAVIFSVDQDDPLTVGIDESGGLSPASVYISFMTYSHSLVVTYQEDVDALALHEYEEPPPPPEDEAKWLQEPDLTMSGLDVRATWPVVLADDFLCTTNEMITNIVVWGSWRKDKLPPDGSIGSVTFVLSFHEDIPAGVAGDHSMPLDPAVWTNQAAPGSYQAEIEQGQILEGWYDPFLSEHLPSYAVPPGDTVCYKYTFPIDPTIAFCQTGTVDNPVVYWLNVEVMDDPEVLDGAVFGWKSSTNHWNDDAVWAEGDDLNHQPWNELRYPPDHEPYANDSLDLAFALYGGPCEQTEPDSDWGDAPDSTMSAFAYRTKNSVGGPSHLLDGVHWLGQAFDAEADGMPTLPADGDDVTGVTGDDDGLLSLSTLVPNQNASFNIGVVGGGFVSIWIDFDTNGVFDAYEQVATDLLFPGSGAGGGSFPVPATAQPGPTYMRIRLSTTSGLGPTGPAPDGEVEDYMVDIAEPESDFGDAPDPAVAAGYETLLASGGAQHYLRGVIYMGSSVDAEADGQPTPGADGDDLNGTPDDEDGITLSSVLVIGKTAALQVQASASCYLDAWVDFNVNGVWDATDRIFNSEPLSAGANALNFPVPSTASAGSSYMRLRVSSVGGLSSGGLADDGEVEDYKVQILEPFPPELDPKWVQRPDCKYGINLPSYRVSDPGPDQDYGYVVCDDWLCDGRPINAIRWWGSYILYDGASNAPALPIGSSRPSSFTVRWFTDLPADESPTGYSMPVFEMTNVTVTLLPSGQAATSAGQVQERYACTTPLDFLGSAFSGLSEHKFEYTLVLDEQWNEKPDRVYWLGIEANYASTPPSYPWGWETTPKWSNWNDDAVVATNNARGYGPWQELVYPPQLPPWTSATAHPYESNSVNMAYVLYSKVKPRRAYAWRQPPDMLLGTDMASWRYLSRMPPPGVTNSVRADDFKADGRRLSDLHWWGSYMEWQSGIYGAETNPVAPPTGVDYPLGFDITLYRDVTGAPGPVVTNLYVPINLCNEMYYGAVTQFWLSVGQDYVYEHEYQYYVDLLDGQTSEGPWPLVSNDMYWISFEAVFADFFSPGFGHHLGWGWKKTPQYEMRLSPSVVSNTAPVPSASWLVSTLPFPHPEAPNPHDLAFEVTTDEVGTNEWHTGLTIVDLTVATNDFVMVYSTGDCGSGTQFLQVCTSPLMSNQWQTVMKRVVPFPPPATNSWPWANATNSYEFYRIIQQ